MVILGRRTLKEPCGGRESSQSSKVHELAIYQSLSMTKYPPAAMSPEAEAFLATGDFPSSMSMTEKPIAEIRRLTHEACISGSQKALEACGAKCSDIEVAGLPCMELTPPELRDGRQLLYLFGGGFVQGSPFEDLPISAPLAAKTNARVIAPKYRLAPEHPFPAALDDATVVATALLKENPATLLVGESAGGNLALALVHRLRSRRQPVPRAIATLSPAADLEHYGDSLTADRDPFLAAVRTEEVLAAYLGETDPKQPEISPIYGQFDPSFPPTLVTTGTRDLLLSNCVRLTRVMREACTPVELHVWEGMWHVFEFYSSIPEAEASLNEIAAFLNQHF